MKKAIGMAMLIAVLALVALAVYGEKLRDESDV